MRKMSGFLGVVFLFYLSFLLRPGFGLAAEKGTLILGWENWPPFQYRDSTNTLVGLDIELITLIFTKAGYVVKYREAPWKRQLVECEGGSIQIVSSAMKLPEREKYAYFTDPYQKETYKLYVRKEDASQYKLNQLSDILNTRMNIGIMRGVMYGEDFNKLMNDPKFAIHIKEVTSDTQNYKKLLSQRIDGFIQEYSVYSSQGKKEGIYDRTVPVINIKETNLYVMLSKKFTDPELVHTFNTGLEAIRQNGQYQQLFEKYGLIVNSLGNIE